MEWIKMILEKAVITDGKLDMEALIKSINTEFPKHAVPKEDYNSKVRELNTANTTITTLKQESGGNEELKDKIETYEKTIADLQTANVNIKKGAALTEILKQAGCSDPDYLIYKHGGIEKFTFDKDEKPIGIEDTIKPYKESLGHLFKTAPKGPEYNPTGGDNYQGRNPWRKDTFNLTEQGKIYKENPAQAKELMAAAGVQ